jgi:hypothetical protein
VDCATALPGMLLLAATLILSASPGAATAKPTPAGSWSIGGNVGAVDGTSFVSTLDDEMAAQGWGDDIPQPVTGQMYQSWDGERPRVHENPAPSWRFWVARTLPWNLEARFGWGNTELGKVEGNRDGVSGISVSGRFESFSALLLYGLYGRRLRVGCGLTLDRRWIETSETPSAESATSSGFTLLAHLTLLERKAYFLGVEAEQHFSDDGQVAVTVHANDGGSHSFEIPELPIDATWVGLTVGMHLGGGAGR